jgi:cobyrinic acid a,c-diamide synthase
MPGSPAGSRVGRLVIAGTHSGVGKTTITLGLLAVLRQRGLTAQPFKVGPDYIDPSYHSAAAGRPCRNLDTWMMPPERVQSLFAHASRDADVAIVEGVMGLFDGFGYDSDTGSTAEVARLLDAPVVLVIDAGKMARSAGALVLGYQRFDPQLRLAGVIVNRAGSAKHGQGVALAIRQATGLPVLGWLPRLDGLKTPERHLGLLPVAESEHIGQLLAEAREQVSRHIDVEALLELARVPSRSAFSEPRPLGSGREIYPKPLPNGRGSDLGPIIAVARDAAFQFTYEENLELLRAAGARIAPFSPLDDDRLPEQTAGIILSGGFPEMHAARLAANTSMQEALRQAASSGLPVYAECGGLMYLCERLVDLQGREWPMVGLLPGVARMQGRLTLGYRLARAVSDSWLLSAGEEVCGHEFHFSTWDSREKVAPAYWLVPPEGTGPAAEGACLGSVWASYVHLHWWSKPELADRFIRACRAHSPCAAEREE